MYTIVYYNGGEVVALDKSNTIPQIRESKHPYYVVIGAFNGVVNPNDGIDIRTEEERLQEQLAEMQRTINEMAGG